MGREVAKEQELRGNLKAHYYILGRDFENEN
jgi:hypothetical protein